VQNKQELAEELITLTEPYRAERERRGPQAHEQVDAILREGAQRARAVAAQTLRQVREAIGLSPAACATK
jgi:tryptophanyl-tRNA synthetase